MAHYPATISAKRAKMVSMTRAFPNVAQALVALVLATSAMWGQSKSIEDLAPGKMLVAPRDAPDSNFAESVIVLLNYSSESALGLMINRRSSVPISRALHELKSARDRSDPVYVGGPVEQDGVMALLRSSVKPDKADRVFDDVFLVSARPGLEGALAAGKDPKELRIYVGYCGWGPGQLDNEVKLGGWYIFDRSSNLVFDGNPDTIWRRLIGRIEFQMANKRTDPLVAVARDQVKLRPPANIIARLP
jgi:putative transcriptional regulator